MKFPTSLISLMLISNYTRAKLHLKKNLYTRDVPTLKKEVVELASILNGGRFQKI